MTEGAEPLKTMDAVRGRVEQLAGSISAPADHLPTYGKSSDSARPHIEIDDRYHWIVVERGEELERRSTLILHQLLYWVFASVTFSMACDYELTHRRRGEDVRRIIFRRQLELLRSLDPSWAKLRAAELAVTLAAHPFT